MVRTKCLWVLNCSNGDDVNGTGNLARAQLTDLKMSSVGAPPLLYLPNN